LISRTSQAELKLLRDLIGTKEAESSFKINLFPEQLDNEANPLREICISKVTRGEILGVIEDWDNLSKNEPESKEKDILDLMDEACQ
jgi:hypothetical protein